MNNFYYLHLLDVNGIRFASSHIQFVISHAESQDPLVDLDPGSEEDEVWCFFVNWFDYELPVIKGNVPNLGPGETDFRSEFVILFVDV